MQNVGSGYDFLKGYVQQSSYPAMIDESLLLTI